MSSFFHNPQPELATNVGHHYTTLKCIYLTIHFNKSQSSLRTIVETRFSSMELADAQFLKLDLTSLVVLVRNAQAITKILTKLGFEKISALAQLQNTKKIDGITISGVDVLTYFGWNNSTYIKKITHYDWASTIAQHTWPNDIPGKASI